MLLNLIEVTNNNVTVIVIVIANKITGFFAFVVGRDAGVRSLVSHWRILRRRLVHECFARCLVLESMEGEKAQKCSAAAAAAISQWNGGILLLLLEYEPHLTDRPNSL